MLADRSHLGLELAGRYKIEEPLATGALSAVYRGTDTILRRPIAVKTVPPAAAEAYRDALHRTASLTHPAIVAIYDTVEHDDTLFLIQEYVQARPFQTYLRGGLPVERAADIAGQLARAVAYAHAHGVTHGDLTPAAILVDRRAAVRLNNFCLPPDAAYFTAARASLSGRANASDAAMASGRPYGETERGAGDVEAIGLVLWQALSTERTVTGEDGATQVARAFREEVPESARTLVRAALGIGDGMRIADADGLVLAIEALQRDLARGRAPLSEETPPALRVAREMVARDAAWSLGDTMDVPQPWAAFQSSPQTQPSVVDPSAATVPSVQPQPSATIREPRFPPTAPPRITLPSRPLTAGDRISQRPPAARSAPPVWASPERAKAARAKQQGGPSGINVALVILVGIVLFILFFVVGFLGLGPALFGVR